MSYEDAQALLFQPLDEMTTGDLKAAQALLSQPLDEMTTEDLEAALDARARFIIAYKFSHQNTYTGDQPQFIRDVRDNTALIIHRLIDEKNRKNVKAVCFKMFKDKGISDDVIERFESQIVNAWVKYMKRIECTEDRPAPKSSHIQTQTDDTNTCQTQTNDTPAMKTSHTQPEYKTRRNPAWKSRRSSACMNDDMYMYQFNPSVLDQQSWSWFSHHRQPYVIPFPVFADPSMIYGDVMIQDTYADAGVDIGASASTDTCAVSESDNEMHMPMYVPVPSYELDETSFIFTGEHYDVH